MTFQNEKLFQISTVSVSVSIFELDGLRIENKSGTEIHCKQLRLDISIRYTAWRKMVFQAEMFAISTRAQLDAVKDIERENLYSCFDSQPALFALKSNTITSRNEKWQ